MPNLTWNLATWDGAYDWSSRGEEWSACWGGSPAQWFGSIYPRICRFLPAAHVLEIAPGFGRWTKFLVPACERLTGIDLSQECVDYCREKLGSPAVRFLKNDGRSLDDVEDASVDFAFSFDSLVHVELDVLSGYVSQLLLKLRPGGHAFLHHSNWQEAAAVHANQHFRAESVSASAVARQVRAGGGAVLLQELVAWGAPSLTDAFTLFGRPVGPRPSGDHPVLRNASFMQESSLIHDFHAPYWRLDLRAGRG